jgi:hypothetical protein
MSGVGTEMAKLSPDWAVQFKGGCSCRDMAKKMDRWGLEGCEARRQQIVAHLTSQSDMLIPVLRGLPVALKRVGASNLLNRAIRRVRKKLDQ